MASEDQDERRREPAKNERPPRGLLVVAFFVFLMLLLALAPDGMGKGVGGEPLGQVELQRLLRKNSVEEVRFNGQQAQVVLRPGRLDEQSESLRRVVYFNSDDAATSTEERIQRLVEEEGIDTEVFADPRNDLLYQALLWFLPTLLLIAVIYFFLFRQFRGPGGPGSLIQFGKSRHRLAGEKGTNVTLKDVAGVEEARQDISEIIAFLKDPKKFSRLGGRIPKGVLLIGPPGTGKTLLAKATAGEAGVPFFSVSGSDFVEMFVGVGASRVRDLFEKAKADSPCIIFLDEVDAVGRRRGSGMGGGHDEREQTLNQILVEMDGFDTDRGIIVMAATNRPDILDPALLRPGRFDRQIVMGMPTVEAREQILKVHAQGKKLALDVDLKTIARATPTFSGAELEALLNEAALAAAMADKESISMAELEEARDKIRFGREKKSWKMLKEEVTATAYHEGGHALVAALVEGCDPLHKVTVVPRGRALGMTMSLPEQDAYSLSKKQIEARICMAFGGRIGEGLYTNDLSTGAKNDIEQATGLARRMVTEWGMSDRLGPILYSEDDQDTVFLGRELGRAKTYSEQTLQAIDAEVRRVVSDQYERAERLITERRDALDRIAEALLRFETISGAEVLALLDGRAIREGEARSTSGALPAQDPLHPEGNGNGAGTGAPGSNGPTNGSANGSADGSADGSAGDADASGGNGGDSGAEPEEAGAPSEEGA